MYHYFADAPKKMLIRILILTIAIVLTNGFPAAPQENDIIGLYCFGSFKNYQIFTLMHNNAVFIFLKILILYKLK